ncbi:RNA-directed DNA polymerase, eukaryota, partial [Tanacetum coccineum]
AFSARDCFCCNKYGHVVDSFIPLKRSKEGKRFGFVKFINVSNVERLVGNLCTVWVGRYKLQANKARFGRPPLNGRNIRNSKSDDRHLGGFKEPNVRPTNGNKETRNNSFASVLKSNQPNNLSSSNMIHDSSPAIALDDDCLSTNDLSCVAIGKIKDINALSNLSVILNDEGFDDIKISYLGGYWVLIQSKSCASKEKLINHAGVLNWFHELGNANNSFVSDIRLVWIAIEGTTLCVLGTTKRSQNCYLIGEPPQDKISEDPFGIYNILNKQDNKEAGQDSDPSHPPGFTQEVLANQQKQWIRELNTKNKINFVAIQETHSSVGLSGGILCVWDPNSFVKDNATISDYFVAVRGTWLSTATKMEIGIDEPCKLSSEQVDDLECDVTFDGSESGLGLRNQYIAQVPGKAFDSVRWDFLDIILRNFGFGIKWRGWIQGCLSSAMGSILVNGSPTAEFKFHKGLKQGDPLSLICHLVIVFIGKWDRANILTIVRMLKCFFLASGLQINILKSKLMGIGVSNEEVLAAANIIGCSTFSTPFSYLGVKVGMSPSRRKAWDEIIGKDASLWHRLIAVLYGNRSPFVHTECGKRLRSLSLEDCWINDVPLSRSFPRLYALELKKGITVADKLIDASFVASFRRNPRGGVEEEQLHHLVELVGSISLSSSNDRWAWLLGSLE